MNELQTTLQSISTDMTNIKSSIKELTGADLGENSSLDDYIQTFEDNSYLPIVMPSDEEIPKFIYTDIITNLNIIDITSIDNTSNLFKDLRGLVSIKEFKQNSLINVSNMFYKCSSLINIPKLNLENAENLDYTFYGCSSLSDISNITFGNNISTMIDCFYNCSSLISIPILNLNFDISKARNCFTGCTSLSSEGLNNLLVSLENITADSEEKTLKYIGLTQEQTTVCETLSNWNNLKDLGWTTGYEEVQE